MRKTYLSTTIAVLLIGIPGMAYAQSDTVNVDPGTTGPAWSPYLVGALIGILSMLTFYFSNKPLGASSAYANIVGMIGKRFNRKHTESLDYYQKNEPAIDWSVMLLGGIVIGAFIAAWTGGELTGRWLPPMWEERFGNIVMLRLAVGFLGGAFMAFGARIAGGCTSGHGISGALQLSVGSWISLVCFFVGGIITAMMLFYY